MEKIKNTKIAFLIAPHDFRDEEYFQPKVILQSRGIEVDTVAKGNPEEVTGSQGGKAHTDAVFEDVKPENYDGIVIVGGPGVKDYFDDKQVHQTVREFMNKNKVIGAICSGPRVLANAGILNSTKVTSFIKDREAIEERGIVWVSQPVVVDGLVVTAQGPDEAIEFGEKIVSILG